MFLNRGRKIKYLLYKAGIRWVISVMKAKLIPVFGIINSSYTGFSDTKRPLPASKPFIVNGLLKNNHDRQKHGIKNLVLSIKTSRRRPGGY